MGLKFKLIFFCAVYISPISKKCHVAFYNSRINTFKNNKRGRVKTKNFSEVTITFVDLDKGGGSAASYKRSRSILTATVSYTNGHKRDSIHRSQKTIIY